MIAQTMGERRSTNTELQPITAVAISAPAAPVLPAGPLERVPTVVAVAMRTGAWRPRGSPTESDTECSLGRPREARPRSPHEPIASRCLLRGRLNAQARPAQSMGFLRLFSFE